MIKPALTAKEWYVALEDHSSRVSAMRRAWYNPESPETNDHALAALALHGQRFGFTREMVKAIRACAEFSGPDRDSELADAAAECIEALLPPEEK